MKVHSIFSGSALLCLALLNGFLIFSARPLSAETLTSQSQSQTQANKLSKIADEAAAARTAMEAADSVKLSEPPVAAEATPAEPVITHSYVATAYSLRGRT
ncbi:MAG TPA: hypothetical protein VFT08_04330, partial [Pyrinomonadaceae bacterium]|nr:hypothetical protein [Pyrinomonadaceae bacterium]